MALSSPPARQRHIAFMSICRFPVSIMLFGVLEPSKITYRDNESYFAIIYDGNTRKWLCRLILEDTKKIMIVPAAVEPPFDKESRYQMETVNDLYALKESLIASANRFADKKAGQ